MPLSPGLRRSSAAIVAALALSASPTRDAHARHERAAHTNHRRAASLPSRLVRLTQPPEGEERAESTRLPACAGMDEALPKEISVRTRGRTLTVSVRGGGGSDAAVHEGRRLLWQRFVGSAGGADATRACASDGWGVVVAGHYRHGDDVYDLFTGKKLGPGDVAAYAPDLSWALVPPQLGWVSDACLQMTRVFRVPLDGSRRPYALDMPPVWPMCDEGEPGTPATVQRPLPASVAISPDGQYYAIATRVELALYRASDDVKIARFDRPRFVTADFRRLHRLAFSRSGRYLVLAFDERDGVPDGETWYRIDRRARR